VTEHPNLGQLESDVERARARLADDLSALRSPTTWSEFSDGLKHEALQAKEALVEKVRSTVQSRATAFVEDLKTKAAANPGAALVIGAGLAWRFFQRPPIATALVGAGLFSLLRTSKPHLEPNEDRFAYAQERLKQQAAEVGAKAGDLASEAAQVVRERASEVAASAAETARDIRIGMSDFIGEVDQERSSSEVERLTSAAQEALSDVEVRNNFLLGAAGVAIAAAIGLAYQRRRDDWAAFE
jgi:hypothetical protein